MKDDLYDSFRSETDDMSNKEELGGWKNSCRMSTIYSSGKGEFNKRLWLKLDLIRLEKRMCSLLWTEKHYLCFAALLGGANLAFWSWTTEASVHTWRWEGSCAAVSARRRARAGGVRAWRACDARKGTNQRWGSWRTRSTSCQQGEEASGAHNCNWE